MDVDPAALELAQLVEVVGRLRSTPRKGEKVAHLANLLRVARGREIELVGHYLSGSLPQGRIGIGWRMVQEALTDAPAEGATLTVRDVDHALDALALERGPGSNDRKHQALQALLGRADPAERRFLAELLVGELRQGALEGLLLEAVARAADLPAAEVRQAAMFSESLGEVARVSLEEGRAGLRRFSLRLLSPVAPMLASPAGSAAEALDRLGRAAFEYKLDGARIQVHKSAEEVRVFTRQLQDVTERVPEIVEWTRSLPTPAIVFEGEALALRPDGRPHAFQVTMRRLGRSRDVEAARRDLPLSWVLFDCLYLDPEGSLVGLPFAERALKLARVVPAEHLVPGIVTSEVTEAEAFLRQSLEAGHEGLMAKSLIAPYEAGQRGFHWLKLKPAQTLDLVVLAAEWGSGRRKGWLSNLHLGARDAESRSFVMLGKTFKGLTDEMLRWQTEKLLALEERRDDWAVYVRPELVVEIAFADVQESPRYPGGFALRFARVKRHREDKPAREADTVQTVTEILRRQRA